MKTTRYIRTILSAMLVVVAVLSAERTSAQHTLSVTGGTGASYARFYPTEVTQWLWGCESFGLSWRFYSPKPRFVGAVGLDLDYVQRGFSYAYYDNPETVTDEYGNQKVIHHYEYYTRRVNSLMLPFVWQPHVYAARNRLRLYLEAAVVFSYNISSSYEYQDNKYPSGKYEWKIPRDNRFGYGLSGGLGFALLFGQAEVGLKAKYDFGYSDILKNRNKYYSNDTDGRENPFWYQPLRSPMDNLTFLVTVGWRFDARGFDEWFVVRPKKERGLDSFNFSAQSGGQNSGNKGGAPNRGGARGNNTRR
ncbi:MAG: outer membrane beta-barrel protein [Alistipes sp.]|nr:outer membrane beta-barrel protein [Alistipes sp.]